MLRSIAILLAGVLLAACGSDDVPSADERPTPATRSIASAEAAQEVWVDYVEERGDDAVPDDAEHECAEAADQDRYWCTTRYRRADDDHGAMTGYVTAAGEVLPEQERTGLSSQDADEALREPADS